jgi:hypothetical protein
MARALTLKLFMAIALVSAFGIIALLLADGVLDWLLLVLAALPVGVGRWRWRAESSVFRRN